MTRLILVRHGETLWNKEERYQGQTDTALSELGRRQAQRVAMRLARQRIVAVYSSGLSRAYETARLIAERHGLQVVKMTCFNEMNFGDWEGLLFEEVMTRHRDLAEAFWADPGSVTIPGGESVAQVAERVMSGVVEITSRHPSGAVVLVAHGGCIAVMLCAVLGVATGGFWRIRQDNGGISIIEFSGGLPMVRVVNDTSHLEEERDASERPA